jgi:hypothetical protein
MKRTVLTIIILLISANAYCSMRDALDMRDSAGFKFCDSIINNDTRANVTYIEVEKKLDDEWSLGATQSRTFFVDPNLDKYRWMDRVILGLDLTFNRQIYTRENIGVAVMLGAHYQDLTYGNKALYPQLGLAFSNRMNDSATVRLSALTDGYTDLDLAFNLVYGWELVFSGRSVNIFYDSLSVAVGLNNVFIL